MVKNWQEESKTWHQKDNKNSTVYTPIELSYFIYDIIKQNDYKVILDPAIGGGDLEVPFKEQGNVKILGSDIEDKLYYDIDEFTISDIEENDFNFSETPDLIIMNPPFNGHPKRKLYPEIFLSKITQRYGTNIPIIMITGDNFLNNNRHGSKRAQWLKISGLEITSIITLPIDTFENVLFNSQVLLFNVPNVKPHYIFNLKG